MRRPHPRFDEARNAWVTRAGGKLKILAAGPKNADTEADAWDAFYAQGRASMHGFAEGFARILMNYKSGTTDSWPRRCAPVRHTESSLARGVARSVHIDRMAIRAFGTSAWRTVARKSWSQRARSRHRARGSNMTIFDGLRRAAAREPPTPGVPRQAPPERPGRARLGHRGGGKGASAVRGPHQHS